MVVERIVTASLGGTCVADGQTAVQGVTLNWTSSPTPNSGYNVYRAASPLGPYARLTTSPLRDTSFVDRDVQSGRKYYYVTTAVDSRGAESLFSNEAVVAVP